MNYSTTTCDYFAPLESNGTVPTMQNRNFAFSKSKCVTVSNDKNIASGTSAIGFNPTTTVATSSDITIYGYMSSGEVLIASLLLMILTYHIFNGIATFISNIKVKRTILRYSRGDEVPMEDID